MNLTLGVVQCALSKDANLNNQKMISFLELAKKDGAQVVLLPELFLGHYFCKTQDEKFFSLAHSLDNHPQLQAMRKVCQDLSLVVPFSFFEKSGPHYYNSVAMIDATGDVLGVYRKSHIPDGPGYQEKFYFRPGNTGFKVFDTKYARLGCGICWDQWFPEAARTMTLMGADMLLYPSAIGSEPESPDLCTKNPWQRVMKGHAVANMIPLAAANRIGDEDGQRFYGASFACDEFGDELISGDEEEGVKICQVDLVKAQDRRAAFGFFRDRRVELYQNLIS